MSVVLFSRPLDLVEVIRTLLGVPCLRGSRPQACGNPLVRNTYSAHFTALVNKEFMVGAGFWTRLCRSMCFVVLVTLVVRWLFAFVGCCAPGTGVGAGCLVNLGRRSPTVCIAHGARCCVRRVLVSYVGLVVPRTARTLEPGPYVRFGVNRLKPLRWCVPRLLGKVGIGGLGSGLVV